MSGKKIRVENQAGIQSVSAKLACSGPEDLINCRPFRVLFIKPWQPARYNICGPALGILQLVAILRQFFGKRVECVFWDMQANQDDPEALSEWLEEFTPDVVAVSALNQEAAVSFELARITKAFSLDIVTVIGGPFALKQAEEILDGSNFDWVFEGAADRTFPEALRRHFSDLALGTDLPGFSYRTGAGLQLGSGQDLLQDLDELPMPAWELHNFERYRWRDRARMITNPFETRYAFLFTSRGCPYLCNYCHDIFTKRFVYRSADHVLAEMRHLYHAHGVREFHIIDDIFNLHKPRAKEIMRRIAGDFDDIRIAFPNGLRADILDEELIELMVEAGTYNVGIAIETVTPRLQDKIQKFLDVDKASWAIAQFARRGCIVNGFFMLGFPTETVQEIKNTIQYALDSRLTHAFFFSVVPQPGTPIHQLAVSESESATFSTAMDERGSLYTDGRSWYERAYGYDLERLISSSGLRFYTMPRRLLHIIRVYPMAVLVRGGLGLITRFSKAIGTGLLGKLRNISGKTSTVRPH